MYQSSVLSTLRLLVGAESLVLPHSIGAWLTPHQIFKKRRAVGGIKTFFLSVSEECENTGNSRNYKQRDGSPPPPPPERAGT